MTFTRTSPWWLKCAIVCYIEIRHLMGMQKNAEEYDATNLTTFHAGLSMCAVWCFAPSLFLNVRSRRLTTRFVCQALMFLTCICILLRFHSRVKNNYTHLVCCVKFCWVHFLFCAWQETLSNPFVLIGSSFLRIILPVSITVVVFHLSSFTSQIEILDISFVCMVFAGEIIGFVSFTVDHIIKNIVQTITSIVVGNNCD